MPIKIKDMSEWEQNCDETWVGNMHQWRNMRPNPLPWWKRLLGYELERCEKCDKEREAIDTGEWSG